MNNTKQLIIDTTKELIKENGRDPSLITVRDISKRAGIAVSQINYHFSTKDNLIAVCVENMVRDVIGLFERNLKQLGNISNFEKLRYMSCLTFDFLYDNENLSRISILSDYYKPKNKDNTTLTMNAYLPIIKLVCEERNVPNAEMLTAMITHFLQSAFIRTDIIKDQLNIDLRNKEQRHKFVDGALEQLLG